MMILHEHKHETDELDLSQIVEDFISHNERRRNTFGTCITKQNNYYLLIINFVLDCQLLANYKLCYRHAMITTVILSLLYI